MPWMTAEKIHALHADGYWLSVVDDTAEGAFVLAMMRTRAWVEHQADVRRQWKLTRRARKANAAGYATAAQVRARVDYYDGLCWMCGVRADTIDHVIPLARGGSNWPANLRPACRSCNSSKGAR